MLPIDQPNPRAEEFLKGDFNAESAGFSRDEHYVAYVSPATGQREIYIRPYPKPGGQGTVSVGGGQEPVWAATGVRFYRSLTGDRIRRRISVDLPRVPSGLPPIRRHPFSDRVVRLVHAIVRAAVDGDGSLAPLRFSRAHLARSFKCTSDLDTEVAEYRRPRLGRVVVDKNVVAISPQVWLAANELPDLAQGRPPRRANRAQIG